jgi:Tol biopolymer transport system component
MDTLGQNEAMVVGSAGVNGRPLWMPDSSTLLFVTSSQAGEACGR